MEYCKECHKELINKSLKATTLDGLPTERIKKKIFCNKNCANKFYSRYMRLTSEIYRNNAKERFKEWYKKNKKKHNKTMASYYYQHKFYWKVRSKTNENREQILNKLGRKCMKCGSLENLEIHHKIYSEDLNIKDLLVLCKTCHRFIHSFRYKNGKNKKF